MFYITCGVHTVYGTKYGTVTVHYYLSFIIHIRIHSKFYYIIIHNQLQTFFGNMFVRSTDLLNLANVSPNKSFAIHLKVDETLEVGTNAVVQCALLYTSSRGLLTTSRLSRDLNDSKRWIRNCLHILARIHRVLVGNRRIRFHTLLLPVSDRPEDILASADKQAIVALLAKMAAEKVVMVY